MTHTINRLQFEVTCPEEALAFQLRHQLTQTIQEQLTDVIDRVCSKHVGLEEWLRWDLLEIDMGHINPYSFQHDFVSVFLMKFEKELTTRISALSTEQRKISRQVSNFKLFEYFLQYGILPWWVEDPEIDLNEVCNEVCKNDTTELRQFFFQHRFNVNLWKRMILQLNTTSKSKIIDILDVTKKITFFWQDLFEHWDIQDVDYPIINSIKQKGYFNDIILLVSHLSLKGFENNDDFKSLIKNIIEKWRMKYKSNEIKIMDILDMASDILQKDVSYTSNITKHGEDSSDPYIQKQYGTEKMEEKYVLRHAGLVLIAPFLKRFFKSLGLLEGDKWINKDAQYRAVHLLKFLCSGEKKSPEYVLILEKTYCGVPILEPIPVEITWSKNEINECEDLLTAVIEHWKALKNTSVNGLRETFLKRDGILIKKENNWLLQVERKTVDILLDKIPWGYSKIVLPWNDYMIDVEW